jgi:hypothetical protein
MVHEHIFSLILLRVLQLRWLNAIGQKISIPLIDETELFAPIGVKTEDLYPMRVVQYKC